MLVGQRGERDVGAGNAEDDERQQPFRALDVVVREHRLREGHQDRARHRRGDEGGEHAVGDDMGMGLVGGRELLGEAALEAHGRELGGELDHDHRISEAAEQLRPVKMAGDEQEGDARDQPDDEAEEVGPPALGEGGDIVVGAGRRLIASMRRAPIGAGADLDAERHAERRSPARRRAP